MIEMTALSPSGYNAQPWEFIVVQDRARIDEVRSMAYDQEHLGDASAVIFVIADTNIGRNAESNLKDWVRLGYCTEEKVPSYLNALRKARTKEQLTLMSIRNAALAAMTLMYSAENMGYATCPMMVFSQLKIRQLLNLPQGRMITLMIAIRYPEAGTEKPRLPRKSVEELLHWEQF